MTKLCAKCGEPKPHAEFYASSTASDGLLGKCKTCHRQDVKARYYEMHEERAAYERKRFKDPRRRAAMARYLKARRARSPEKTRARNAVSNALRDGRLARLPCQHCGNPRSQAHHHDYSKPLDVEWLCFKCHREHAHGQTVAQGAHV